MKINEVTIAGKTAKVAPAAFNEETCELMELFDEQSIINRQNETRPAAEKVPFGKTGRMLSLLRKVGIDCLVRGGHSPEEASQIVSSLEMNEDPEHGIPVLVNAMAVV